MSDKSVNYSRTGHIVDRHAMAYTGIVKTSGADLAAIRNASQDPILEGAYFQTSKTLEPFVVDDRRMGIIINDSLAGAITLTLPDPADLILQLKDLHGETNVLCGYGWDIFIINNDSVDNVTLAVPGGSSYNLFGFNNTSGVDTHRLPPKNKTMLRFIIKNTRSGSESIDLYSLS
jgi:hypothetical protein